MHRFFSTARLGILWSAFALFFLLAVDPPDPPLVVTENNPPKRPPIIAAWLQHTRGVVGPMLVIIAPHITTYTEISPHSYTIERDGSLTVNNPVADAVLVDFTRLNGIHYLPTVSSGWENGGSILRILTDSKLRANHIDAIIKVARSPNVDGIDLDYENLPPEARAPYTSFVTVLAGMLHLEGKILSVTVPPKISNDDPCLICRYADYAALGAVADRFRVMGYEYHGKAGAPGPVAPIWWLRQVMSYTVTQVPRERVILGVHLYGYDWGGKETPALWWSDVQALKDRYTGEINYAETDTRGLVGESVMTYSIPKPRLCGIHLDDCPRAAGESHTVWFVDARYVAATWDMVKEFQLGGIVMWRPGGEDPAIWDILSAPTKSKPDRFFLLPTLQ